MGLESFGVVRFDLGPLLQGKTKMAKLKRAYNSLIIEVYNVKPTYRKSWDKDENCLVNCICTDESKYPSDALLSPAGL